MSVIRDSSCRGNLALSSCNRKYALGMSLQCPYKHVSYATWRLEVLRNLFQPSQDLACGRARTFRQSRNLTQSERLRNQQGNHDVQNASAPVPPVREKKNKNKYRPTEFSPFNIAGRTALRDVLDNLKTAAQNMKLNTEKSPKIKRMDLGTRTHRLDLEKVVPTGPKEPRLLNSPVFKRQEQRAEGKQKGKLRMSDYNLRGLQKTHWAEILASPIRACHGSGSRIPSEFLLDFSFVKHPVSKAVYLMPTELADLHALERRLESDRLGKNHGVPITRAPTHARVFANITFLRFMSETLTKPTGRQPRPGGPPRPRKSVNNEVGRLIPFHARETYQEAQRYKQTKTKFDAAVTGNASRVTFSRSPGAESLDTYNLQWQYDVPVRIAHIMRLRILVALRALVKAESDARTSRTDLEFELQALPLPASAAFEDETLPVRAVESPSESQGDGATATQIQENRSQGAGMKAHVPPPKPPPELEASQSPQVYHHLGHREWRPGSILLHVGHSDLQSLRSAANSSSRTLPPLSQTNPLIPPMIAVGDTYRFPVFSLYRLFTHAVADSQDSESDMSRLRTLIAESQLLHNPDGNSPSSPDHGDYLLRVQPRKGPGKDLIEEVWRLWQYLGGENMDVSFPAENVEDEVESDTREESRES
jgi:hypothetical protein